VNLRRIATSVSLACVVALLLDASSSEAESTSFGRAIWESEGVPVSMAPGYQNAHQVTTDGEHGFIIVWADGRSSSMQYDVYAQRVRAEGEVSWQPDGMPVIVAEGNQIGPRIVSDETGGAIIAWSGYRGQNGYDVFAQRLDSNGDLLWLNSGITVTEGTNDQYLLNLVPDGVGGAFAIWEDWPEQIGGDVTQVDVNIFAQHLDNAGNLLWSSPVTLTTAPRLQYVSDVAPDVDGGFLATWCDLRNPEDAIYAQRVSADGDILWEPDGALVSANPALQYPGPIVSDGAGWAYVAWHDFRTNHNRADVYLQHLSVDGFPGWATDLPVAANYDYAEGPDALVSDGSGGVLVIASRSADGAGDVLAQRVNEAGELLWGAEPVNLTPWPAYQGLAVAVPDGQGGAYIAWLDTYFGSSDVWAQHLAADGARLWSDHGVKMSGAAGSQQSLNATADGDRGLIVAWQDGPHYPGDENNLYAQRAGDFGGYRYFLPMILKSSASIVPDSGMSSHGK